MKLQFSKMHGLRNDFMVVDNFQQQCKLSRQQIILLADRKIGVGFDQLLILEPSSKADFLYCIYNADGSEVYQCGNGARCVTKFAIDNHLVSGNSTRFITKQHKVMQGTMLDSNWIQVKLAVPIIIARSMQLVLSSATVNASIIDVGNPHAILFVDELACIDFATVGSEIEHHPQFPDGINVSFVKVISPSLLKIRIWERGVGETEACGSAACAAAVAAMINDYSNHSVTINFVGGNCEVSWQPEQPVVLTGEAHKVYDGTIDIDMLTKLRKT
jgi:diaminopimelate epimerase